MNKTMVMGIINVTPDSFSGDGINPRDDYVASAASQALQMLEDGADILDIGGESSRPGSTPISAEEECRRVIPVIEAIRRVNKSAPLSVDSIKAEVVAKALQAGATIINDITALDHDQSMSSLVASSGAKVVLMHNRAKAFRHDARIGGTFDAPHDVDIIASVKKDLQFSVARALEAGIKKSQIILDPGIGFGKTPEQNVSLIVHLAQIKSLGFPLLMGVSRKSFIGLLTDTPVETRLSGTAACVTSCVLNGADILRVHDVRFMAHLIRMAEALRDA